MHHSKACFCASSVATFLGLCLILAAFSVIANVTYDKLMDDKSIKTTTGQQPVQRQPQQQQFPQPVNPYQTTPKPNPILTINSYLLSIETADFWVVLLIVLAVGIFITCMGYCCSNCAICCCTSGSRPGSVRPGDSKEWPSDA